MSNPHFSNYVSPNIVIVPTVSFCGPPSKKLKPNVECQPVTHTIPVVPVQNSNQHCQAIVPIENISKNVSIQNNPLNLRSAEDTSKNDLEDSEQRVKKTLSWASNYLQSIGQSQPKVTKLANPVHLKLLPKVVESTQQNTNKNLFKWFKPTLGNVSQSHSNNLPQSSNANGAKNHTLTESNSTKANNSSHDAKYPIKINLINPKRNTDPFSDKANTHNILIKNDSKTLNFKKPYTEERTDSNSSSVHSYSKIIDKNDRENEKYVRGSITQNFGKSCTKKSIDYISTPSHSKSREINTTDKEKHDKVVKTTESIKQNKIISIKKYTDVSKERNKVSGGSKLLDKTKNDDLDKSFSKSHYKTRDGFEARDSDRNKSSLKKPLHPHVKDRLEEKASNKNKVHPEKPAHVHIRAPSNASRKESKKETIKPKSKKPLKKENDDHKTKSKPSKISKDDDHKTKSKPSKISKDDDQKNDSRQSTKSNNISKTCEKSQSASLKSVVQIKKHFDLDRPFKTVSENGHHIRDLRTKLNSENGQNIADLRATLKRKYQTSHPSKHDNLIITVQNDNNDKEDNNGKQPVAEEKPKLEKKTRKYKKIKLVINVVCEKCSESSESDSDNRNNEEYPVANVDLSFLDDFNVDDIVDSLNDQENKANNNSPIRTQDTKIAITEIDAKPTIKNEDKEDIKCINIQKSLHESPQFKMDLKQEVIEQETKNTNVIKNKTFQNSDIPVHEIQTAGKIPDPRQNIIEKNPFEGNTCTVLETEKSYTPITSPIKLATNHNNNTIIGTAYNHENIKKAINLQNNTRVDEPKHSNVHQTNDNITNMNSETQTKVQNAIIIDLTQIETGATHETEKIPSNNIKNTEILKQATGKTHKTRENRAMDDIIDLTTSPEIAVEIMKDLKPSFINTPSQRPIEIKENSTNYDISKENQSKIKNDKKEEINVSEIPLPPQDNKTKEMGINNDIIDLTVQTEIKTSVKSELRKSDNITIQKPKEQQHDSKEKVINNIHSQTTGIELVMKKHVEISPEKNIIDIDKSSSNIAAADNRIQGKATKCAIVHATEKAAESRQHEINKSSPNQVEINNIAKEQIVNIDIDTNAKPAGTAIESQEHNASENSRNNAVTKNYMKATTEEGISNAQTTDIVPGLQKLETNETLSIENVVQETSLNDNISNAPTKKLATGPNLHISNKTSPKDARNVPLTMKVSEPQSNNVKKAISSQQVCDNSKPNIQELAEAVEDTQVHDDTEDVLSITGSLDEHLTSYNSMASDSDKTPIRTTTGTIKSLIVFDAKEEATSEKISKQLSKTIEKKQTGEPKTDKNKEKNGSAETEVSVLEKRMMEYFRDDKYSIESLIRSGKFSKIYRCKDGNGRNYALKVLNKGTRLTGCRVENMLNELQKDIPRKNYHCVFLVDGFATIDRWCFLMDFYPKNMKEVLYENGKCFHIDVVQTLARQLISAVLILRNHNIMHLDIKPSHILMNTSNDRLKLAGFDESRYLEGLSVLPNVGTVNYRPPEVILGYPYFEKIDVWSTALVIYEMCTARQLFPGQYNNDILYKQMCTLGDIPFEMVNQSVFTNYHYRGGYFARRYGPAGQQCVLIDKFKKSVRLATSLFEAYHRDWGKLRTKTQKADDSAKLRTLRYLLEAMLMLDPNRRYPIEFVYTNSLIYETFDSCP